MFRKRGTLPDFGVLGVTAPFWLMLREGAVWTEEKSDPMVDWSRGTETCRGTDMHQSLHDLIYPTCADVLKLTWSKLENRLGPSCTTRYHHTSTLVSSRASVLTWIDMSGCMRSFIRLALLRISGRISNLALMSEQLHGKSSGNGMGISRVWQVPPPSGKWPQMPDTIDYLPKPKILKLWWNIRKNVSWINYILLCL